MTARLSGRKSEESNDQSQTPWRRSSLPSPLQNPFRSIDGNKQALNRSTASQYPEKAFQPARREGGTRNSAPSCNVTFPGCRGYSGVWSRHSSRYPCRALSTGRCARPAARKNKATKVGIGPELTYFRLPRAMLESTGCQDVFRILTFDSVV